MNQSAHQPELLRIALVEDDEEVRYSLMMLLRSRGFAVDSYRNGMEILMNQPSLQVDCLLIDYKLPRFDGIDLLEKMRVAGTTTPAVLITGYYSPHLKARALKAGFTDVVEKSSKPQDVLNCLATATGQVHQHFAIGELIRSGPVYNPDQSQEGACVPALSDSGAASATQSGPFSATQIAGITSTVSAVDDASPNRSEIAKPWKIGSVRITAAPIIAAKAVSRIGLNRMAPASSKTSRKGRSAN